MTANLPELFRLAIAARIQILAGITLFAAHLESDEFENQDTNLVPIPRSSLPLCTLDVKMAREGAETNLNS